MGQAIDRAVQYFQALQTRRFIKTESDYRPSLEKVYYVTSSPKPKEEGSNPPCKVNSIDANRNTITTQKETSNNTMVPDIQVAHTPENQTQTSYNPNKFTQYYTQYPPTWSNQPVINQPAMKNPPAWASHQPYVNQPSWQQFPPWMTNQYQSPYGRPRPQAPPRRNRSNIICYFCEKPGHYKNECFIYLRTLSNKNAEQTATKCTYCGKIGHQARDCWHLQGNNKESQAPGNTLNPFRQF